MPPTDTIDFYLDSFIVALFRTFVLLRNTQLYRHLPVTVFSEYYSQCSVACIVNVNVFILFAFAPYGRISV